MTVNAPTPAVYEAWQAQQRARPELVVPLARFAEHLGVHWPAESLDAEAMARLCLPDLYLVCGCLAGDPASISAFERELAPVLERAVASFGDDIRREVTQGLRAALLVDHRGRGPLLREYSGQGAVRRWLRVVAAREATRLYHAGRRESPPDDDALFDSLVGQGDLRGELARLDAARQFRHAFSQALLGLPPRERTALRMHVVDGLTIDQIAPAFEVHRATAARWLGAAHEGLLAATRRNLMRELALGPDDADSLIRAARSRLELSLERMLGEEDEGRDATDEP